MRRFQLLLAVLGACGAAFCVFVGTVLGLWVGGVRPELAATRSASLGLYVTGILWLRNCIHDQIPGLRTSVFVDEPHLDGDDAAVLALDKVLFRCVVSDRRRRYASVSEMAEALLPALSGCPALVKNAGVSRGRHPGPAKT